MVSPTNVAALGDAAETIYNAQVNNAFVQDAQDFVDLFEQQHEIVGNVVFMVMSAEGMNVVIDAAQAAGDDREKLRDYLASFTEQEPQNGYFGSYYFDEYGDGQGLPFAIHQVQNGENVIVYPPQEDASE